MTIIIISVFLPASTGCCYFNLECCKCQRRLNNAYLIRGEEKEKTSELLHYFHHVHLHTYVHTHAHVCAHTQCCFISPMHSSSPPPTPFL